MRDRTENENQINLMAFPSETTIRFVILFVCCLLVVWYLSDQLIAVYPDILFNGDRARMQALAVKLESDNPVSITIGEVITQDDINQLVSEKKYYFELMRLGIKNLVNTGIAPLLFVVLCVLIYLLYPALVRLNYKLQPLGEKQQDVDLYSRIKLLCAKSGIVKIPILEIDKRLFADAQVFGAISPMHIRITRGLQMLLKKSQESFDAMALHELSHIINKDVTYTYIAQIAWDLSFSLSLAWTIILVYAALFRGGSFQYSYSWLFGFIFTFGFIRYSFQNVLRTRELYADWRVARLGLKDELIGVLKSGSAAIPIWQNIKDFYHVLTTRELYADWRAAMLGLKSAAVPIWQNIINFHPPLSERVNSLESGSSMVLIKKDLFASVGILLGFLIVFFVTIEMNIQYVRGGLVTGIQNLLFLQVLKAGETPDFASNLKLGIAKLIFDTLFSEDAIYFFLFFVIALFISATIGFQVQWFAAFSLSQKARRAKHMFQLFVPAILCACGIELGIFLSVDPVLFFAEDSSLPLYLVVIISVTFMTFSLWLWFLWIYLFSRVLYSAHRTRYFPRIRFLLVTIVSGILLTPLLNFFYDTRLIIQGPLVLAYDHPYPAYVFGNVAHLQFQLVVDGLFYLIAALISLFFLWALTAYNKLRKSRCPFCKGHLMYSVHPIICGKCGRVPMPWLFHPGVT
jgi:Zn-dependent protease with chaperone function